jgi:hypothetical protein
MNILDMSNKQTNNRMLQKNVISAPFMFFLWLYTSTEKPILTTYEKALY